MGQGLYNAVIYGTLDDAWIPREDGEEPRWLEDAVSAAEKLHGVKFDRAYEAEPRYWGIVLAVSDECLADWWKVPAFADRKVVRMDRIEDLAFANASDRRAMHDKAHAAWMAIDKACFLHGVRLPLPNYLFVSDWD